jgi:hypothetical protein
MAKKYTAAQWARLQAKLPKEDRVPYSESPDLPAPAPSPAVASKISAAKTQSGVASAAIGEAQLSLGDYYAAQAKAGEAKAAAEAAKQNVTKTVVSVTYEGTGKNRVKVTKYSDNTETREPAPQDVPEPKTVKSVTYRGKGKDRVKITTYSDNTTEETQDPEADTPVTKNIISVTYKGKGKNRVRVTKYSDNTTEEVADPEDVTITDSQFLGSGANRILRTYYSDGTYTDVASPDTFGGGSDSSSSSSGDAATNNIFAELQKQNAALLAQLAAQQKQSQEDAAAAAAAVAQEKRENAITSLTSLFSRYGLASLVPKIKELAISGASESTITLQLMESPEYKMRFSANQDRIKKGLSVLDPGDYLNLEDSYRQILRAYGLRQFDTDAYVQQFIANDVSTAELSSRVVTAVQRVQNADPAILTTLRSFYGISDNDLVAYVLDPNQQFQKIERQVAAAEIGAAAGLQGISTGVSVAEQLAAQGVTKAQAQKGYATIADILPTAEKLSGIYDKTLPSYGLAEAEQEVFNTLASAQRKRRALAEREIAEFSGASGLSKSALSKQIGGQY